MKKLLVYLKGYEKETVLAPLFKMLEALFELFVPLVMAAVIDVGIGGHDRGYVIRMCLVLIALGVIGLACSITAQYFAAKAATGFSTVLRRELFAHIQSLSYTEMDNLGTSTLITRMTSDINQVQSGVNLVLRLFLRSPFIVFGAMIMAFTVDVKAAMIFVVAIPMLSVVVFGIMIWTMPLYRRVQGALDKVLGLTRENLTGVRVIRAFCLEEQEQTHFREKNERLTDMQKFVGKISGLMNPLTYIIVNGAVVVLLYTGAIRVDQGIITTGAVVALVNYMNQILVELVKLAKSKGIDVVRGFTETEDTVIPGGLYDVFLSFNFLEHQPDPVTMLRAIWNNLEDDAMGLITVPSFEYIMEHSSYYELIRDHIAYYTFDTLTSLMERSGFDVVEASMINRDTLSLIVRKRPQVETENLLECYVNLREEMNTYMKYLRAWHKTVCIWGASHQGFTLAATTCLGENAEYIIDSAPFKHGKYAPASHLPIVPPEYFEAHPVDAIVITAPGYTDEIAGIIRKRFGDQVEIRAMRSNHLEMV